MADDLLQAFAIFNQGLDKFAQSRLIKRANDQAQSIKDSGVEAAEQRQLLKSLAGDTQLRLLSAGADPASTKIAAQGLMTGFEEESDLPKTIEQMALRAALKGDERLMNVASKAKSIVREDQEQFSEEQRIKRDERSDAKEKRRTLFQVQQKYNGADSQNAKALRFAKTAKEMLDKNTALSVHQIGGLMARASGDVGRLSDFDVQLWSGSQAIFERMKQLIAKNASSEVTESNREKLKILADQFIKSSSDAQNEMKRRLARQTLANPLFKGSNLKRLEEDISGAVFIAKPPDELPQGSGRSSPYSFIRDASGATIMVETLSDGSQRAIGKVK